MLSLDFAFCSPGKVWGRVRLPISHIVGCDDSKLRNCNTCLLESTRGITMRSFIGVIYQHPIMEKNHYEPTRCDNSPLSSGKIQLYCVSLLMNNLLWNQLYSRHKFYSARQGRWAALNHFVLESINFWLFMNVSSIGGCDALIVSDFDPPVIRPRRWSCKALSGYRKASSRVLHEWFHDSLRERSL